MVGVAPINGKQPLSFLTKFVFVARRPPVDVGRVGLLDVIFFLKFK